MQSKKNTRTGRKAATDFVSKEEAGSVFAFTHDLTAMGVFARNA
jgi:hypothetical protein